MTNPTNHNSWEAIRKDFHKFSIFMAKAQEAGELKMKDIESTICDYYLKQLSSLLESSHKEIIGKLEGKKIPLWQDEDVKGFNYGLDTAIRIIKDLSKLK